MLKADKFSFVSEMQFTNKTSNGAIPCWWGGGDSNMFWVGMCCLGFQRSTPFKKEFAFKVLKKYKSITFFSVNVSSTAVLIEDKPLLRKYWTDNGPI